MKAIVIKNKAIALLLFLFSYNNLYAISTSALCRSQERLRKDIASAHRNKICEKEKDDFREKPTSKNAFIYLSVPRLGDEYLEYGNEDINYGLEVSERKERAIPINIEFNSVTMLNPRKEDREKYMVSSKIKERIIFENASIARRNCTFMALGSEYLFPVPAKEGILSVILYFDYSKDVAPYNEFRRHPAYSGSENYFDQFIHRSLYTEVNFKPGRIYQIEIAINPNSALPRGSYNATTRNTFETMNTVPGFTITLKELPANTKFAFDGKDDVGKTYEQVKKEFILYDHDAEKTKE
jgi:hypothetical protein